MIQPISHDRLQAFLSRNQKLIQAQMTPPLSEHKHSSETNSNTSNSETRGKTDSSKDKGRSVSPIHTRELSNINSDQNRNSDSFLSSDKDLQPFINSKPTTVNLLPEIDYLYSYATNNNTTLKTPTKASINFLDRDNSSRDQEYYSAQKSPFKREPQDLFDFRSNPVEVGPSSRSVSPKNSSQKEFLTNRLEAYLSNKKKFQEKLKENYSKDIVKNSNKTQNVKSPKSSADNSMRSKMFKKEKSPSKSSLVSVAVPNYAKPTKSTKNSIEARGNSPDFPKTKSSSITPRNGPLKNRLDSSNSSSRSKLLERTPTKRDVSLTKSKSAILKSPTAAKTPDRKLGKNASQPKLQEDDKNKLFNRSSKKLQEIDQTLDRDSIYKNEIKNLIKTIKEEKEQVSKDLLSMAAQMSKYKHKYKKLKKQLKGKKNQSDEQIEEKSENTEDVKPQKRFEEALYKKTEDFSIYTVDDLKTSKKTPKKGDNFVNNSDDLMVKCETLNKKVDSIVNGIKFEYQSGSGSESGQINELPKTPEIAYIIKNMGLDPGVFFVDPSTIDKNPTEPGLRDMNFASKNVIQFLYEKLVYEQYQRLRTEEQANDMITSMQKTICQLEEKRIPIRK